MAFVIISMSLIFLIGSVMWLMPSKHEKQKAALRARAIAAGVSPKFIKFDHYLTTLPLAFYKRLTPPRNQLVRYTWQGERISKKARLLQIVFLAPQPDQLKDDIQPKSWVLIDGKELNSSQIEPLQQSVEAALGTAKYLEGLVGLECRDSETKRQISLFWLEEGVISEIDFESVDIKGLQAKL